MKRKSYRGKNKNKNKTYTYRGKTYRSKTKTKSKRTYRGGADVNNTLKTNCHCICIFTKDAKKWQDAYNFIKTLWNPRENRPILFTDNQEDKTLFLQSNKLIR